MPTRATGGSVGYDLYMYDPDGPVTLQPGSRALIRTGVYLELPEPERCRDGLGRPALRVLTAEIRPRSGLALKHGVTVLNTPGTIDVDFRGELGVLLVNTCTPSPVGENGEGEGVLEYRTNTYTINNGDRIAQLVFNYVMLPALELVEELDGTSRGSRGFGSSGV